MSQFQNVPFRSLRLSVQSLRQTQILILEILHVFLWLKFSPSLALNKLKRFETGSKKFNFLKAAAGKFSLPPFQDKQEVPFPSPQPAQALLEVNCFSLRGL